MSEKIYADREYVESFLSNYFGQQTETILSWNGSVEGLETVEGPYSYTPILYVKVSDKLFNFRDFVGDKYITSYTIKDDVKEDRNCEVITYDNIIDRQGDKGFSLNGDIFFINDVSYPDDVVFPSTGIWVMIHNTVSTFSVVIKRNVITRLDSVFMPNSVYVGKEKELLLYSGNVEDGYLYTSTPFDGETTDSVIVVLDGVRYECPTYYIDTGSGGGACIGFGDKTALKEKGFITDESSISTDYPFYIEAYNADGYRMDIYIKDQETHYVEIYKKIYGNQEIYLQSDWEENDEASINYIKNRPFYYYYDYDACLVSESDVTIEKNSDTGLYISNDPIKAKYMPIAGNNYWVDVGDGNNQHTAKRYGSEIVFIGNLSLVNSSFENSGEDFLLYFVEYGGEVFCQYASSTEPSSSSISVTVTGGANIPKPLDAAFIPDTIARKSGLVQSVNGTTPNSWGEVWIAPYIETKRVEIVDDVYTTVNSGRTYNNNTIYETPIINIEPIEVSLEEKCEFVAKVPPITEWDGLYRNIERTLELKEFSSEILYVGNPIMGNLQSDSDGSIENICIIFYHSNHIVTGVKYCSIYDLYNGEDIDPGYFTENLTIEVSKNNYVQIDEKFIPDTIARVSDIPEGSASDALIEAKAYTDSAIDTINETVAQKADIEHDHNYVAFDAEQSLTDEQKLQARNNIGIPETIVDTLASLDIISTISEEDGDTLAESDGTILVSRNNDIFLPEVNTDNNGEVLTVVDGKWTAKVLEVQFDEMDAIKLAAETELISSPVVDDSNSVYLDNSNNILTL